MSEEHIWQYDSDQAFKAFIIYLLFEKIPTACGHSKLVASTMYSITVIQYVFKVD